MRTCKKWFAASAFALVAVSAASAETAPTPAPVYPYGYVNPFDPNWWLTTLNNMAKLYTVPGTPGYVAPAAAPTAAPQAAPAHPSGYVNFFDPNWWLSAIPASAGATAQAPAAATAGSAYVPVQTPYGPIQVFNYADPMAWNKLFAQPLAMPGQGVGQK